MEFIADLHIHSYLSRATAKDLNLEYLNLWAKLKGIAVVGTGDFTHPRWFSELSEKLEPADEGLYKLKPEFAAQTAPMVPPRCDAPVRFLLSVEISSIYKKNGKTRKVHNVILVPSLGVAEKINARLDQLGNIASDGRPILGLDSRVLLEIILEVSDEAVLIPAHIWTPWFSVLGSKSGFDSIEACFEDLTPFVFAVETGLSSDPAMNWRVSSLDGFSLVSNSDAHSPANLGREANVFNTPFSYAAMMAALKGQPPNGFLGTLEYFAEEGKYHFDGHRKCGVRLSPSETRKYLGLCPVCGKPATVGVMSRVEALADRPAGVRPQGARPYVSLLPLTDVLSEVLQMGPKTKKVSAAYKKLLEKVGPEFEILRYTPTSVLDETGIPLLAEGIRRMRAKQMHIAPGYDGEFGRIRLFEPGEHKTLLGQRQLFAVPRQLSQKRQGSKARAPLFAKSLDPLAPAPGIVEQRIETVSERTDSWVEPSSGDILDSLNPEQRRAVCHRGGPLLIVAGPGTGKTRTLTHRMAHLLATETARPEQILAVTFTNKAANEMAVRLKALVGEPVSARVTIRTFHGLCLDIITAESGLWPAGVKPWVSGTDDSLALMRAAMKQVSEAAGRPEQALARVSLAKQRLLGPEDDLSAVFPASAHLLNRVYKAYQGLLRENGALDFDDLILVVVKGLENDPTLLERYQRRFAFISVDEYQDVNHAQYRLVRELAPSDHDLCVIGDPDQAIYGFRGADVRFFERFSEDYPGALTVYLRQNYRCTETILRVSGQVIQAE
ncbi:MAG: UvrD-helicase domain-containing protein, partial [Deltaproteobacteria bacterium]|nr:UvrD-helicase domain-containing protein [Deltaproteobacteria bacterium]